MGLLGKPASLVVSLLWVSLAGASSGEDASDVLRKEVQAQIETAETEGLLKEAELSNKYLAALEALEKKQTAAGDLDAVVHLREERESVRKNGGTTSHAGKPLVELREKYLSAIKGIRDGLAASREKIKAGVVLKLKEQETALTKAGKVEEALALRKETERMLLELSAGTDNGDMAFDADPRAAERLDATELKLIEVPIESPPLVPAPFSIKGRWLDSMTLPVLKQRISEQISIGLPGEGKRPSIVIPKGSVWSGKETVIMVSAGKLIATKSSFQDLRFLGDLGSTQYFSNCLLQDCGFNKGGGRVGGEQAAKIYFGNCVVTGGLAKGWNIRHTGYRGQGSGFEKVELPAISFEGREPARYVNHPWVKFANCRFVNCKVPSSFAAVTRDCIFENCEFIDDPKFEGGTKPFEVVLFLNSGCRWNISKLPATLTLTRKPETERKGDVVPTAQALRDLMAF